MTSSSWNQFINQFLLEFGWIDWKVDVSMLRKKKKKTQIQRKIWKLQTTESQKVSSSICLLGAQFPLQVRIKGFILTISFQNGFFRQTKCKLSRVPNIPNYCSSYKTLPSLKLFLDLAWMLQPNDPWVQPVLTVLSGPAGRNCDRRQEIGTGKGTNSIVCVPGAWE